MLKLIYGFGTSTAIACLWVAFTLQPASAHGGGLNKQGCHNNHKTGDYHCH